MIRFLLGVMTGVLLVAILAAAQADWEQPVEEGQLNVRRETGQFVPEPPVRLWMPERGIAEDPIWNEKQRLSLERLIEDMQERTDKQDESVMQSIHRVLKVVWDVVVQMKQQINAMFQSQR